MVTKAALRYLNRRAIRRIGRCVFVLAAWYLIESFQTEDGAKSRRFLFYVLKLINHVDVGRLWFKCALTLASEGVEDDDNVRTCTVRAVKV